jgi:hypothetical protein
LTSIEKLGILGSEGCQLANPTMGLADRLAPLTGRALPGLDRMTQRMNPTSCPLSSCKLPRDTLTRHIMEELQSTHSPLTVDTNLPHRPRPPAATVLGPPHPAGRDIVREDVKRSPNLVWTRNSSSSSLTSESHLENSGMSSSMPRTAPSSRTSRETLKKLSGSSELNQELPQSHRKCLQPSLKTSSTRLMLSSMKKASQNWSLRKVTGLAPGTSGLKQPLLFSGIEKKNSGPTQSTSAATSDSAYMGCTVMSSPLTRPSGEKFRSPP